MKIDTHTHLFLTKESKPDWKSINFYFDIARMKDLDVVCCTEHLDAIHYSHLLNDLFLNNILGGELLDEGVVRLPNGLIATSGAEVALSGGADVGLHTQPSILKSLNKNKGYYTLESLLDTVSTATDSFVIVGHHLYRPGKWIDHIEEKSHLLDAIELPAKDIVQKEKYRNLSTSLKKNFVAGSDAHTWAQIGVGYTMCSDDVFGFSMFKNAIKTNKVSISISPEAEQLVQISSAYRKHLIS